jgi:glutamyl-Q tRNA(Asp) synthetase
VNAVKSSTATGTTATASRIAPYRGRFAPSPTGALHTGSLVAALASWLDARAHCGTWLIRMEDLDRPRVVPGAADTILATLAAFGMESDEPVLYQSRRHEAYTTALQQLAASHRAYRCECSRSETTGIYNGRCRHLGLQRTDTAWRLMLKPGTIGCHDSLQGDCSASAEALGDPIIFRRDGLAAYQLAVVVDDAAQGITHVVRGADLLDSTCWQIAIGKALGLPIPLFSHVPLITEPDGSKLAKSTRSVAIDPALAAAQLVGALRLLQQQPSEELTTAPVRDILSWAVRNWQPARMAGLRAVCLHT